MAVNKSKLSANISKLLSQGKYERALGEMERLVQDDPNDHRTMLRMAETYAKMGRPIDAIQTYENVATQYTSDGFHMKAIAVFKQMLRVDNNLTSAHKSLAEQYHALGMQQDCIRHYEITASLLERGGRLREALTIFRRMVEQQPQNIGSRIKLADFLMQQRMKSDALREYQAAAEFAQEEGLTDEYITIAEKWFSADPTNLQVGRTLGRMHLQRADPQKALTKLQQCFQQNSKDAETLNLVAEAFKALGQNNKSAAVQKELARLYDEQGLTSESKNTWKKVLEIIHDDEDALRALGAEAATMSSPSAKAAPTGNTQEMLNEVTVFITYGLHQKAIALLRQVIETEPEHLDHHLRLYDLLKETNDPNGLAGALNSMVGIGQKNGDARIAQWQKELAQINEELSVARDESIELDVALNIDLPGSIAIDPDQDIAPDVQVSVDDVLGQFKDGVKKSVRDDDAATHFELGIAYKEMGLFQEAKDAFHLASQSRAKEVDAHHMTAVVLMDEGDTDKALNLLDAILRKPNLTSLQKSANLFQKGLCHQRLQQVNEAIEAFRAAAATGEPLPGLQARIDLLTNAAR